MWYATSSPVVVTVDGTDFTVSRMTATQQAQWIDAMDSLSKDGASRAMVVATVAGLLDPILRDCSEKGDKGIRDENGRIRIPWLDGFGYSGIWRIVGAIQSSLAMGDMEKKSSSSQEPYGTET